LNKTSVFIVEDELIEAEDIRHTLKEQGYSIAGIARSGEGALSTLREMRPDLILMDIHLNGAMDGIDAAEQIRVLYHIPVIFLTAHADDTTLARAKITEPYGYILKPFDDREVHSVIEMALYKHRMEERLKESERIIRVLANAISDAIMLVDHNNQIIALNDAMARRIGRNNNWLECEPAILYDSEGSCTSMGSQLEKALGTRQRVRFEERNGDGWAEISLTPVGEPFEDHPRVLIQYHDITDYKRFEEQLKKEGVTRLEQNMEQFQILNDQIRNPLQAIMGYVNLDCVKYKSHILNQIGIIDSLVDRLDNGWIESEKVRKFLLRHYRSTPEIVGDTSGDRKRGSDH
jgi:two-component system, response regulator PdtaR